MKITPCILLLILCSCGGNTEKKVEPLKEKFYRGNIVEMKLDGKKGMVIDKRILQVMGKDKWNYTIRFPYKEGTATTPAAYVTHEIYEYELVEPKSEKE